MKLYIIRHGETNENQAIKLMGRTPGKLSENGKEQAKKTGIALAEKGVGLIYSSPLSRCVDTAEIINEHLNKKIVQDLKRGDFKIESLERHFKKIIAAENLNTGELLWPLRVALTGEQASPSPFEVIWVLGQKETLKRIQQAIEKI